MVSLWRGLWGRDDLPFYYVEIAPSSTATGSRPTCAKRSAGRRS
ncbi:MAG: hypothetical protein ACLRMJ_11285 [Alistipes finegoldii]